MKATKEEMKNEALRRLEVLKEMGKKKKAVFFKTPIDFFKNGDVPIFENQNRIFKSVFYGLYLNKGNDPYDSIIAKKEEIEKEDGNLVYLIQISHTCFGDMAYMFVVSSEKSEWALDEEDMKEQIAFTYAYNMSDDYCSEYGSIKFEFDSSCGGLYAI